MQTHRIYFDSDMFHVVAGALRGSSLPDHLRSNIVLSPISAFEIVLKLTRDDGQKFFRSIQAMQNWLPDSRTVMDWPPDVMASAFGVYSDSKVHLQIGNALERIFLATSFQEFVNEHKHIMALRNRRDADRNRSAELDSKLVHEIRKGNFHIKDFPVQFVRSLAKTYNLELTRAQEDAVLSCFSAHFEFRIMRLSNAVKEKNHPFGKQANDVWDSYQLVYLAYSDLRFITGEKKFGRLQTSNQRTRIRVVRRSQLQNPKTVQALLEQPV